MTKRADNGEVEAATLRAYLEEISRLPRMTPDEEEAAGARIQQGDEQALNGLVEANLRFVVSYAKRYRGLGVSFLDLIHEGNLGLLEAARRFDPSHKVKFITYAVWWIRQRVVHALSDQGRIVSLPERLSGPAARLARHLSTLSTELDRPPTMLELADDLDISEADAGALMQISGDDVSLTDRTGGADQEVGRQVGDLLPQRTEPPVEEALVHEAVIEQLRLAIVKELSENERKVMLMRFGLDDGEAKTLQDIGARLVPPVSRERVRQIEARAKEKLRRSTRLQGMRSERNGNAGRK